MFVIRRYVKIAAVFLFVTIFAVAPGTEVVANEKADTAKRNLAIELNSLEQRSEACRLSFLISNQTGEALDALAFELVLFDTNQQIMTLVNADAGALPVGKSRVKQFDIAGRKCSSVSRLLLNDITRCKGGSLSAKTCLQNLTLTSRAEVPLIY